MSRSHLPAFLRAAWPLSQELKHHLERGIGILGPLKDESGTRPPYGLRKDWMKDIPDDTHLSRLSVPGTHDAAAYNYDKEFHEFWNCQSVSLFRQLDAGIRAFDLRYALKDGKLRFFHSTALLDTKAEVEDIICGLHVWLDKHPSETIFVSLKVDNGDPEATDVKEAMATVLKNTEDYWVLGATTLTPLHKLRGKLVLLRRFPFGDDVGFSLSNGWEVNDPYFSMPLNKDGTNVAWIEDFYLLQNLTGKAFEQIELKTERTLAHLSKAQAALKTEPENLWITFSSAVGDRRPPHEDENVTPRVMALGRYKTAGVNQHLVEWCKSTSNDPVGVVFMDFVTIQRSKEGDGKEDQDFDLIEAFIKKQGASNSHKSGL